MWNDLPLRWKGAAVVIIPVLPLVIGAALLLPTLARQQDAERSVRHTLDVQSAVNAVEVSLLAAEGGVRGFALTGDRGWLAPYEEAQRGSAQQLAAIRSLVADNPAQVRRLDAVAKAVASRLELLTALLPYPEAGPAPRDLVLGGHQAMEELQASLRSMNEAESELLAIRRTRVDAIRQRAQILIAAVAIMGIGGGFISLWLFVGDVTTRLANVCENAQRLARGEPLVPSQMSRDEVGRLEHGLSDAAVLLERRVHDTRVARDELDHFFGLSLDMLCIATMDGRFQRLNPAWETTLGWSMEALTSSQYLDFVHPDDQERTARLASELSEGTSSVAFVNRCRAKDGGYRALSWKVCADPERRQLYATARDITDEQNAAEALSLHATALAEARLAADRANQAKTTFLSHMSHDLRTPLNAILGFAQLLQRDALTSEQLDSVRQIRRGGQHLLELISEVIDITRIESGQMSLSLEAVAVEDVVNRAVALVTPLASEGAVTLTVEPIPPDLALLADRQRVHQILLNFLSNAVKYNRRGGSLTVGLEMMPLGRCRILVSDTGAGLTAANMEMLFQPFERLGAERTAIEGSGLGLALSRGIAEAMGGSVGARSIVDHGTTFWVELPTIERPHRHPVEGVLQGAATHPHAARRGTVLYIEDNSANVRLMERIIRQRPELTFVSAANGEAGLTAAHERKPNLIFLDLHLPDMTGEDVLKRLWQDPATRNIPCVMLTADATPGLGRRLRAVGARDHLTKPLDVTQVIAIVDQFLAFDGIAVA